MFSVPLQHCPRVPSLLSSLPGAWPRSAAQAQPKAFALPTPHWAPWRCPWGSPGTSLKEKALTFPCSADSNISFQHCSLCSQRQSWVGEPPCLVPTLGRRARPGQAARSFPPAEGRDAAKAIEASLLGFCSPVAGRELSLLPCTTQTCWRWGYSCFDSGVHQTGTRI